MKFKRFLALLLSAMMLSSFAACAKDDDDDDDDDDSRKSSKSDRDKDDDSDSDDDDTDIDIDYDDDTDTDSDGEYTKASLEKELSEALSCFGVESFSLPDAESYEYAWGYLTLDGCTISDEEMTDLFNNQLTPQFNYNEYEWSALAGTTKYSITIFSYSEGELLAIISPGLEDWTEEKIKECEDNKLPVVEKETAVDAFPDNFSISFTTEYNLEYTVTRINGDCYFKTLYPKDYFEGSEESWSAYAFVSTEEGVKKYGNSSYNIEWSLEGDSDEEEIQNCLNDCLGDDTQCENTPGMWVYMCYNYIGEGEALWSLPVSIGSDAAVTGTENIAGVECDVVEQQNWGETQIFKVDPETGILYEYTTESEGMEKVEKLLVTEWDDNPGSLGDFPGVDSIS